MTLLAKHDLEFLGSCLCCHPKHYRVAQAAHRCDSIEELIELYDYLIQHNMPNNLVAFFNELISRRKQNEKHDSIN